jgi:hypothetical protein
VEWYIGNPSRCEPVLAGSCDIQRSDRLPQYQQDG